VPKDARKHYAAGFKAIKGGDSKRAIAELQEAVKIHPPYYGARLELGRELAAQKRYQEAADILKPLGRIAPKRREARAEYGKVLLNLRLREAAAGELLAALRLDDSDWEANYYLGWALLETDGPSAEQYFLRSLDLNQEKAVRAYIALAQLAEVKGRHAVAIKHLETYLALAPDAPDATFARQLVERLRR
jgi:tetratricopeptide (TPR) repeat protein